jgi:hypothetical protein
MSERSAALERARQRLSYATRQRLAFESRMTTSDEDKRTLRKLLSDERLAESDLGHSRRASWR